MAVLVALTATFTQHAIAGSQDSSFAECTQASNASDWKKAESLSRARLLRDQYDAPGLLCMGFALEQQKRFEDALAIYQKMELANPTQYRWNEMQLIRMYFGLSQTHKQLGHQKEAAYFENLFNLMSQDFGRRLLGNPVK